MGKLIHPDGTVVETGAFPLAERSLRQEPREGASRVDFDNLLVSAVQSLKPHTVVADLPRRRAATVAAALTAVGYGEQTRLPDGRGSIRVEFKLKGE